MREIKKEMMEILAKDFKAWYDTLNEDEKLEYSNLIKDLKDGRNTNNTRNVKEK